MGRRGPPRGALLAAVLLAAGMPAAVRRAGAAAAAGGGGSVGGAGAGGGESGGGAGACSRERSRHARGVVAEALEPLAEAAGVELKRACPLRPERDMFLEHEQHKERLPGDKWRSTYAGKMFRSEYFVDLHMDNRHMDKVPPGADVCLADFCEVLRCDDYYTRYYPRKGRQYTPRQGLCREGRMAEAREECRALLEACIPEGLKLRQFLEVHLCDNLTCQRAARALPELMHHLPADFHALRYIGLFFSLVVVVFIYAVTLQDWGDRQTAPDLRRIPKGASARGGGGPSWARAARALFSGKDKHF